MKKEKAPKEKKELTPEQKVRQNNLFKIIYASIVGFFAVASLSLFAVAQYTKAKLNSADIQVMAAKNVLSALGPDALEDEYSDYHDKALYFNDQYEHFSELSAKHMKQYTALSITAYSLSIMTLVSFGLVLKHSDKRKEQEDK